MKKILLLFSICLIPMLGYAQTDENGKERVYIDYGNYIQSYSLTLVKI